jgi:hypothetical protein
VIPIAENMKSHHERHTFLSGALEDIIMATTAKKNRLTRTESCGTLRVNFNPAYANVENTRRWNQDLMQEKHADIWAIYRVTRSFRLMKTHYTTTNFRRCSVGLKTPVKAATAKSATFFLQAFAGERGK